MAIVKWNPSLFPATMGRFFDDFFSTEFPEWSRRNYAAEGTTLPAVNIKETDDDYQIEIAAPGMNKKDFKLEVDNGVMTISAKKKESQEEKDNGYSRREFRYTSFQRSFTLPDTVNGDKIEAKYNDGILIVNLPKKPEAKPRPVQIVDIK